MSEFQCTIKRDMGQQDIEAKAIQQFVAAMIGARESGFEETSNLTLANIHSFSRFYINLQYDIESPTLAEEWGPEVAELCKQTGDTEQNAARYRWLRERDLDTISQGGVFAGQMPEKMALNGEDLDQAVDEAMQPCTGAAQCKRGAILYGNSCLNCEREKAQQGGES